MLKRFKIGLALGGGAARALAHIGVLEGLAAQGIPVDIVTGTSMGAVIGGMYASDPDASRLRARISRYLYSDAYRESGFDFLRDKDDSNGNGLLFRMQRLARRGLFNTMAVTRLSIVNDEIAERNYAELLDGIDIERMPLTFAAIALDLHSGEEVVIDHGPLRRAVAASCAIPGILSPVPLNGHLLVDGGWAEAVPVRAAFQLGASFVIAVDVVGDVGPFESPRNALDVVYRADALVRGALVREQLRDADCVLVPKNGEQHWADFRQVEKTVAAGRNAFEAESENLHRKLQAAWQRGLFLPRRLSAVEPAAGTFFGLRLPRFDGGSSS